jgi:hypothetical protein
MKLRAGLLVWLALVALGPAVAGCEAVPPDLGPTPEEREAEPAEDEAVEEEVASPAAEDEAAQDETDASDVEPSDGVTDTEATAPEGYPGATRGGPTTPGADDPEAAGLEAAAAPVQGLAADPLSNEEAAEAAQLALGAAPVQDLVASAVDRDMVDARGGDVSALSGRPSYRVLYSERYPGKDEAGRVAEVAVYRYDTAEAAVTKVNLDTGEVSDLAVPAGYPLPLVPQEVEEAEAVALADPGVQDALTAAGLDPDQVVANALLTGAVEGESPCGTHRCLRLFFSTLDQPVPRFSVVVDLVALSVVEVVPMPEEGSQTP